jgi:hypothetical protein
MRELVARVRSFRFQIKDHYDDHVLSDLFKILEEQGAQYQHLGPADPGKYLVNVPGDSEFPFYRVVKECPSVEFVGNIGRESIGLSAAD